MDDRFLAHHGVLGMKWGVRRYRNADGSLTAAGRRQNKAYKESIKDKNDSKLNNKNSSDNDLRKQRIKKGLMIAGGVAVAAVGTYAAYKLGKNFFAEDALNTLSDVVISKKVNTPSFSKGKEFVKNEVLKDAATKTPRTPIKTTHDRAASIFRYLDDTTRMDRAVDMLDHRIDRADSRRSAQLPKSVRQNMSTTMRSVSDMQDVTDSILRSNARALQSLQSS